MKTKPLNRPTVRIADVHYEREAPPMPHVDGIWWKWQFTTPTGDVQRGWVLGPKTNCQTVARRVVRTYNNGVRNGLKLNYLFRIRRRDA